MAPLAGVPRARYSHLWRTFGAAYWIYHGVGSDRPAPDRVWPPLKWSAVATVRVAGEVLMGLSRLHSTSRTRRAGAVRRPRMLVCSPRAAWTATLAGVASPRNLEQIARGR